MGIFDFFKSDKVVDLSGYGVKREDKTPAQKNPQQASSQASGNSDGGKTSPNAVEADNPSMSVEERRKMLTKRLVNMTERLDILSTQLYHLQQRVELLEKKFNIGG